MYSLPQDQVLARHQYIILRYLYNLSFFTFARGKWRI